VIRALPIRSILGPILEPFEGVGLDVDLEPFEGVGLDVDLEPFEGVGLDVGLDVAKNDLTHENRQSI
jgi:hypothetical protein